MGRMATVNSIFFSLNCSIIFSYPQQAIVKNEPPPIEVL